MRKIHIGYAALFVGVSGPAWSDSPGSICIDGKYLVSGESRQIEVFDVNANASRGTYTMEGGQITGGIPVTINDSGYVNVRYRNLTNNGSWINDSLKHSGDCIKP